MAWEEQVFSLLEDLEQQAESMYAVERGSELADRARSEYATVTLAARLAAGVGAPISLEVRGVGRLTGKLISWNAEAVTIESTVLGRINLKPEVITQVQFR